MTTTLIPSTSSAPTLRELAIAEHRRTVAEYDESMLADRRREFARRVDVLRIHLRDKIGMVDSDSVQISEIAQHSSLGFVATTADGLRFTLRDLPHADRYSDREQLHVAVHCDRNCGKDLWVHIDSLVDLGSALDEDVTHTHDFACLQQFDDDGDPITDRLGNLLPKREPRLTPEQNARASIAAIEAAAIWVADALNNVARLEDERALIKPEAIRRIMESRGMAATPAEKIVEADPEYAAHREKQRDAEVVKWAALGQWEASRLAARLDVQIAANTMRESE